MTSPQLLYKICINIQNKHFYSKQLLLNIILIIVEEFIEQEEIQISLQKANFERKSCLRPPSKIYVCKYVNICEFDVFDV